MFQAIFSSLDRFENVLWAYFAFPAVIFLGIYLSLKSQFFQLLRFPAIFKMFLECFRVKEDGRGIHPLKAFFACVGGCVGIGNIVGICTAVQVGGPGALFWIWIIAIFGSIVKYAEVYLGVKYRVENKRGGYDGGPMYFLTQVTKLRWVPQLVALLLCIYGVEIYQFTVMAESLTTNFSLNHALVALLLLFLIVVAGKGGVKRVGNIAGFVVPLFVVLYTGVGFFVLIKHAAFIPAAIVQVFKSAFSTTSAVGGFIGSTLMLTISQGVRRGCYTADVGVGYASVIHSETSQNFPENQAALVIFDVFLDTFLICTMSVLLILVTGVWSEPMEASLLVQTALSKSFPCIDIFMPFFIVLLGFSTIISYFCVGLKCAEFISEKRGRQFFYAYSLFAFVTSIIVDTSQAQSIMAIAGGLLAVINCLGIYRLRNQVRFFRPLQEEATSQVFS